MSNQQVSRRNIRILTKARSAALVNNDNRNEENFLEGILTVNADSPRIILFAHGSGSGKQSLRNTFLAEQLNRAGFSTLLFDLLTTVEKQIDASPLASPKFEIKLLSQRLMEATAWISNIQELNKPEIGYFSASTGSAAAMIAASKLSNVKAIVSRSGRIDLVQKEVLDKVQAQVLLILAGNDTSVNELTREFGPHLTNSRFTVIQDASHLFEEQGKIEEVSAYASRWFRHHFLQLDTVDDMNEIKNIQILKFDTQNQFAAVKRRFALTFKFRDRKAAAESLATLLAKKVNKISSENNSKLLFLAIPRGGVIIGDVLAAKFGAELDFVFAKKLRSPINQETSIGAVFPDGSTLVDEATKTEISQEYLEDEVTEQREEIRRRANAYRDKDSSYQIRDRPVVLVDDGIASGLTMMAAARWVRQQSPSLLVIAVPIISKSAVSALRDEANEVVSIFQPTKFQSVEQFYNVFEQVHDEEVLNIALRHGIASKNESR